MLDKLLLFINFLLKPVSCSSIFCFLCFECVSDSAPSQRNKLFCKQVFAADEQRATGLWIQQ